jgi:pimeloyl-ACP methyl ester carboxylesterase
MANFYPYHNFEKEKKMKHPVRILIIALLLILLGGFVSWTTQTSGGSTEIKDVRWVGSNGTMMSGLLYIPEGVTAENPAPGIVAIHGYINSREVQDGFSIEFARRGYIVLASDQTGHGYSDGPAFANGFGGLDALAYLRTLDIVDKDNIGLEGHSMGGWALGVAAGVYPDDYKAMVLEGSSTGTFGAPEGTPEWPRNLGLVFSEWDEFSGLMWLTPKATDIVSTDKLKALFDTTEDVEIGKLYGSIEDGTARMLYQPRTTHPGDHLSTAASAMQLNGSKGPSMGAMS